MESKKISFGFSKISKKTNIIFKNVKPEDNKVELVECLEGQSIKVKGVEDEIKQPLVIPLKDNHKNVLDQIKDAKKRSNLIEQHKNEKEDTRPDSELTTDELAARQLIKEAKAKLAERNISNDNKVFVLPLTSDNIPLEGEKEPTLEDYESVPISDFGLALLRGMGWKEGTTVGKNTSKTVTLNAPELRPKGLGLGATKIVQSEIPLKKAVDRDGKELILIKGAYAKIIAGAKKGNYCEVLGFDEEAGRVIVKLYPKGENLNVNEFMLVPVTKEEFSKGSKILNNAKYEEYLEISDRNLKKNKIKQENSETAYFKKEADYDSSGENNRVKDEQNTESLSFPKKVTERNRQKDRQKRNNSVTESSDSEAEKQKTQKHRSLSYKERSRSRSSSKHRNKARVENDYSNSSSDDSEYYKMKKKKHSKSRYHNEDENSSRYKHKKDDKHKKHQSSSYERDRRNDKKKSKSKSRHRRRSSS